MASISDNFNRPNSADINANNPHPSWTWTDISGVYAIDTDRISIAGTGSGVSVRAESDLGSADHEVSIDVTVTNDANGNVLGPMVRHSAADVSGFLIRIRNDGSTVKMQLFRYDSTTPTQLGGDVDITADYVAGLPVKAKALAGNIYGYYNGVLKIGPTADAAYGSNLRTGLRGFNGGLGTGVFGDNFLAQDIGTTNKAGSLVNSDVLRSLVRGGLVS